MLFLVREDFLGLNLGKKHFCFLFFPHGRSSLTQAEQRKTKSMPVNHKMQRESRYDSTEYGTKDYRDQIMEAIARVLQNASWVPQ